MKSRFYRQHYQSCLRLWVSAFFLLLSVGGTKAQSIASASAYDFSVQKPSQSLKQVFTELESKFQLQFNYVSDMLDDKFVHEESSGLKKEEVDHYLQKVLAPFGLMYEKMNENQYIIYQQPKEGQQEVKKMDRTSALLKIDNTGSLSSIARNTIKIQEQTISGTVTDLENGEGLPGVNIIAKGTATGTVTDMNGSYKISVGDDVTTLVFSSIGYLSEEVEIGRRSVINIQLSPDIKTLSEIVVVGYGQQEKKDVTGAMSSVEGEDIVSTPVPDLGTAMQGKVAGVDITQANGNPGANPKIRIRGNRSITATNEPLVVVDGIPFIGNLNDINTSDIKSVDILKDASATAIYGSRGANGVILVTTKRGKANQSNISVNAYYGFVEMAGDVDVRNADEFVQQRRDVAKFYNSYTNDQDLFQDWELEAMANGVDTDWMGYNFRNGYRQNYQVSFSGGNENSQYLISGGFYDEQAIIYKGDYQRFTFRLNLDQKVNDWLNLGTSTNLSYSIRNNGVYNPIRSIQSNPLASPFDENGDLIYIASPSRENTPNATLLRFGDSQDEDRWLQLNPNFFADVHFTEALTYRLNLATSFRFERAGDFHSLIYNNGGSPDAQNRSDQTIDVLLENIVSYDKHFDKHHFQATGLYSIQQNRWEYESANVQDLPYESQLFYNIGSAGTINSVESRLEEWGLMSVMGRLNYSFDDKYMLTVTARADGSSRLADGNKWGFFPSVAASWRISEEPFMQSQTLLDDLKLRASFGRVGNTGINPYQTQGGLSQASYNFGSKAVFGYYPDIIANPDLGWEMTNTFNLGVDFSMFEGRLSGSVEGYRQFTSDLILNRQLPWTSGYSQVQENVGKTQNTGFEFTLMAQPITSTNNGFSWSTDFTIGYNKEEIVELYNGAVDDIGSGWFIGEPVDAWYYYEAIGIWQEDEADEANQYNQVPGSVKLKDQNEDGKIDADDRTVLGSPTPRWNLGWNNTFRFKGFDFSVYAYARLGQVIRNEYYHHFFINAFAQDIHNGLDLTYWTPENPVNTFPAASSYNLNDFPRSLGYVDGSFLKIRDITLGYTFDNIKPFSSIRVYTTAYNMITFYKKMEAVTLDIETDNGLLGFDTPLTQSLVFGVNLNF